MARVKQFPRKASTLTTVTKVSGPLVIRELTQATPQIERATGRPVRRGGRASERTNERTKLILIDIL